jgi:hypothetical protein
MVEGGDGLKSSVEDDSVVELGLHTFHDDSSA